MCDVGENHRAKVLDMLQRCERLEPDSIAGSLKVTLPSVSPKSIALRIGVTKLVYQVSHHLETFRVKVRNTQLKRARSSLSVAHGLPGHAPPLLILMVYRAKNYELVEAFLRHVDTDADVRLWALDQIAPSLSRQTLGCGPGLRFPNLNELYNATPVKEGSWVVVADDDFLFIRGSLVDTINMMKRANLSLAQPGQSLWGWWSALFNVARPFMNARDTNYVEQGPLVIADPLFAQKIFPLPETNDMGWGIEAEWYRMKDENMRMGIVDACRVVHWNQNAESYAVAPEIIRMNERLASSGVDNIWQLQSVNGHWWRWQRTPTWKTR